MDEPRFRRKFRLNKKIAAWIAGVFSALALAAMVFSLLHAKDRDCWIRTLFYLCLPQILCESLRVQTISWLFIKAEQLVCFLVCEGVLVWYALRKNPRAFRSWIPALCGLAVCGLLIAIEFALDGKSRIGGEGLPHWLLYTLMVAGLAVLAIAEHKGSRSAKLREE